MPNEFLPAGAATVLKAANRLKKKGAAQRAKDNLEKLDKAKQMEEQLAEKGGVGVLLLSTEDTNKRVADLGAGLQTLLQVRRAACGLLLHACCVLAAGCFQAARWTCVGDC